MFGFGEISRRYDAMDEYAQHASNIRDRVVKEFDYELSKDEPSIKRIRVIVDVFRKFEYMTSKNLRG